MIIGNGLIANALDHFKNNEDYILFASGVSNSSTTDEKLFEREINLLRNIVASKPPGQVLIYISTFNVYDTSLKENKYVKHKLFIEKFLLGYKDVLIARLPIVLSASLNPNTLINFFYNKICNKENFILQMNAWRYLIAIDDVIKIITQKFIIENLHERIVNIAHPEPIRVTDIVKNIEILIGQQAVFELDEKGNKYIVNDIIFESSIKNLELNKINLYFNYFFEKYYLNGRNC